jgi:hypothetical protein
MGTFISHKPRKYQSKKAFINLMFSHEATMVEGNERSKTGQLNREVCKNCGSLRVSHNEDGSWLYCY